MGRGREQEAKTGREQETKTGREQEAKTGREQEAKTGREQEAKTGREQEAKTGREQMQGTVLIQSTAHRGTGILPFFAKRKRKRRGGQASVPLHPLLPGEGSPRTPPRGKGVLRF